MFLIAGHTDAVGSDEDNLSLSDRRAEAVARVLTDEFGVPPENLVTQGYGEQDLLVPTQAPRCATAASNSCGSRRSWRRKINKAKVWRRSPVMIGAAPAASDAACPNVSQAANLPLSKPLRNQVTRCSEEPWVKASGTTRPWVRF